MFALAAIVKANAIEVTFAPPPRRSTRPARRNREDTGLIASIIRPLRRALAMSADENVTPWIPRLVNYPY